MGGACGKKKGGVRKGEGVVKKGVCIFIQGLCIFIQVCGSVIPQCFASWRFSFSLASASTACPLRSGWVGGLAPVKNPPVADKKCGVFG